MNLIPGYTKKYDLLPSNSIQYDSEQTHLHPSLENSHTPWTFEEIKLLPIKEITETQWFIFMWVGSGEFLEKGRDLLKHWGFRRCEDIVWIKTKNLTPTEFSSSWESNDEIIYDQPDRIFKRTKEHCLVGIKGTVRRVSDTHLIHTNIDTDVIIGKPINLIFRWK